MDPGRQLTLWTIRLALLCYVLVVAGEAAALRGRGWSTAARSLWSAGCLLQLAHVVCAFHFRHQWSHASAYLEVASETRRLFGRPFGAGVYFNYGFTVLWSFDAIDWWLRDGALLRRPRALSVPIQALLLLIVLNGAVVFASGPIRWWSLAACLLVGLLLMRRRMESDRPAPPDPSGPKRPDAPSTSING